MSFLDDLMRLPGLAGPALSPDGRYVAWTFLRLGPAGDVYVTRTDGSWPEPIKATDTGEDTWIVSWTSDSRGLIVEHDHDGDERAALYLVEVEKLAPGRPVPAPRRLTDERPAYFIRGGDLHPNGRWLVYGMNQDAATGEEIEPTWVYRHDLVTGEKRVLARPVEPGGGTPELNDPGTQVLYNRNDLDPGGEQVWLVDIDGQNDREILNFGAERKVSASWLPDGKRMIFVAEVGQGDGMYKRVGLWSGEAPGTQENWERHLGGWIRWLVDEPARDVEDAFVPERSDAAVIVAVHHARPGWSLVDLASGRERPGGFDRPNFIPLGLAADGAWVGEIYNSRQPSDLVVLGDARSQQQVARSLSQVWDRAALRPADFVPAEEWWWPSADGLRVQGWLYRARGTPRGTVVHVHGGPTAHSEDRVSVEIQYLVREGFHVLDPNYRGSTGFGLVFQEKIKEDGWGGREQEDLRTGIASLIAAGIARPGKVGITGTSYGGYSSWWAITHFPPELCAAAVPICGMTDLVVDYQTTRPDLRPYSEEMIGGAPEELPEKYRQRSPIHFVGNIRGKLLIVQGLQDPNVTPENVRAVRAALDAAGVDYQVLVFEDEGHGIGRPKNQRVLFERIARFFGEAFG